MPGYPYDPQQFVPPQLIAPEQPSMGGMGAPGPVPPAYGGALPAGGLTPEQAARLRQPLGGQDPRSAYLAQALQEMSQKPQGNAMGLTANLLADALDRYGLNQRQQQLARPATPSGVNPEAMPDLKGVW